jgi:hypothetical protein
MIKHIDRLLLRSSSACQKPHYEALDITFYQAAEEAIAYCKVQSQTK